MITIREWRQLKRLDEELEEGGEWALLITELSNRVETIDELMKLLGALGGQEGALNQSIQKLANQNCEALGNNQKHAEREKLIKNRLELAKTTIEQLKHETPDDNLTFLGGLNRLLNFLDIPGDEDD